MVVHQCEDQQRDCQPYSRSALAVAFVGTVAAGSQWVVAESRSERSRFAEVEGIVASSARLVHLNSVLEELGERPWELPLVVAEVVAGYIDLAEHAEGLKLVVEVAGAKLILQNSVAAQSAVDGRSGSGIVG